ncbi:DUF3300 domain-containing protein [Terriglobus roseus]|uniref:DUF3300 domain-containing protein n=1 Tax=Terriglobus roseus TaxID=392734 RepID=A0A1G7PMI6_9BACT|nr:DUF3300 domain-containing protein [Terriglobus roseus]SDF87447.1 Protein of unknown function [Terriglobus roseus]
MVRTCFKQFFAVVLSFLLVFPASELHALAQQQAPAPAADSTAQPAPLSAAELEQVVAPIALYPDALVAQVLGAATFPDQVTAAHDWLEQNKKLTGIALSQAVDKQQWDPSVKALTQFPSVLDNMVKNLSWTSSLGEAYHTQAAQVMTAIQSLRAKAKAAGNLKTGSQITVVQQSPDVIVIQPTNPQVVYVPQYNPTVVYGAPVQTPGYSTAAVVGTALLAFGVGIAVGAAINNNCCGWGYSYWNCNWHGGAVVYRSNVYYGNRAWRGGAYGSSVTAYGPYGAASAGRAYNPTTGTYARGAAVSTPYGTRTAGQAYNPYTGTAARGGTVAGPNGAAAAGQAYNARTGAYASTHQVANAYGNAGSSVVSRNGQTTYTQHETTANGTVAAAENSRGGAAVAGTGYRGNSASAVRTANGNSAVNVNGHVYTNTGNRGYGAQRGGGGAFGGGGSGWESRQASARGGASRGGFRGRR